MPSATLDEKTTRLVTEMHKMATLHLYNKYPRIQFPPPLPQAQPQPVMTNGRRGTLCFLRQGCNEVATGRGTRVPDC